MDPVSMITGHPELVWVALAIFTLTETVRRVGQHLKVGAAKAWGLVITLVPLTLGAIAGLAGFVPGATWQQRLAMGIAVALPVMVGWKVGYETSKAIQPARAPNE